MATSDPLEGAPIGPADRIGNVVVELSVLNGRDDNRFEADGADDARARADADPHRHRERPTQAKPACDPKQRLLPAGQRDEICFWFELGDELPGISAPGARERLVEAELHVFKLFPQVLSANAANQHDDSQRALSAETNGGRGVKVSGATPLMRPNELAS